MSGLLHVSDPHFGTERPEVVDALRGLVARTRPRILLLTGDVTQRATRAQFDAAARFVSALPIPHKRVVPGNHDIPLFDLWTRLRDPYRRYRRAFGEPGTQQLSVDDFLVVSLNTTRWWRHKHGELSDAQIEDVANRIAAARPDQLRVVAVHQPLAVTSEQDTGNLLRGHERALSRWRDAGVDLVLGGHIHLPFALASAGPRTLWVVQAGTATSSRVRAGAPNSVNLLQHDADRGHCLLQRWDYDATRREFAMVQAQQLGLSRQPTGRAPA